MVTIEESADVTSQRAIPHDIFDIQVQDIISEFSLSQRAFEHCNVLSAFTCKTSQGLMIGVADDTFLYYLQFLGNDTASIKTDLSHIKAYASASIIRRDTPLTQKVETELSLYFQGRLRKFTVPLHVRGTSFQKKCWQALQQISYGKTVNYGQQAYNIGYPKAYRAVANANARNPIAIIIPCHRVICHNGAVGGYRATPLRKSWLLAQESRVYSMAPDPS